MLRLPSSVIRGRRSDKSKDKKISKISTASSGFPSPTASSSSNGFRKSMIWDHTESIRFEDAYSNHTVAGKGGFGTVRRVTLKNAKSVVRAAKTVQKEDLQSEELVRREVAILKHLDHPNICRILETYEDEGRIYIVLEFIDGRELFDEIAEWRLLDENVSGGIMQQLFSVLQYCHERNVIHRDLKPENIMVHRANREDAPNGKGETEEIQRRGVPVIKVIDFGLSIVSESRSTYDGGVVGSRDYLSPEAKSGRCMPASDLYSAGLILHAMLAGCLPSVAEKAGEEPIAQGGPWESVSQDAKELVCNLVQLDPAKRMTAADAAKHPWTRGVGATLKPEQATKTMADFVAFHKSAQLRRAALTAVAMQLTNQQLQEHKERFQAIDVDGNGRISKEELVNSLAEASSLSLEELRIWVEDVFDSIDTDGSQEIEYTEWLAAAMGESTARSESAMLAAFRVFDTNNDGRIDGEDFAKVMTRTPSEVGTMMRPYDYDGDGSLNFEEFKRLVSFREHEQGDRKPSLPSTDEQSDKLLVDL